MEEKQLQTESVAAEVEHHVDSTFKPREEFGLGSGHRRDSRADGVESVEVEEQMLEVARLVEVGGAVSECCQARPGFSEGDGLPECHRHEATVAEEQASPRPKVLQLWRTSSTSKLEHPH